MRQPKQKEKTGVRFQSARSKVIAGFVLAALVLVLFWAGSRYLFDALLYNVEKRIQPNDKLVLVHQLFQDFARIDQMQRHIAVQNKRGRRAGIQLLSDSLQVHTKALKGLYEPQAPQYQHLLLMEDVLEKRHWLFWQFIEERDRLVYGNSLEEQTRAITDMLSLDEFYTDSMSRQETYQKITRAYIPPDTLVKIISHEPEKGLFNRLFGKKKIIEKIEDFIPSEPDIYISEMVDSVVSSVSLNRKDTILPQLEAQLLDMVQYQRTQAARMDQAELNFLRSNNALANEILSILYEIEEEELRNLEEDQMELSNIAHKGISIFNVLLISTLVCLSSLIFFILIDFSRSRQFRMQLIRSKEEAEHLSRIKERFLSNMSHEIRTPLQSIIGYTEQILKTAQPSHANKEAIYQSARHLLQIVNEILDYNRLVAGRFHLEPQPFDLQQTLEEVCMSMAVQAKQKGLEFMTQLELTEGCYLNGDAFRLKQILYNLLGNAIKFTDQGSVNLFANMQCNDAFCQVQFSVHDTGIGISEENIQRIFNQFEQASGLNREYYGGTGLGLSIVKALVELHGGDIVVRSNPGKGSEFLVQLQYPKATSATLQAVQTLDVPVAVAATNSGVVHIVDDDTFTLRLSRQILQAAHFDVQTYTSAINLLKSADFKAGDLILTDINLPEISGYETLRRLRAIAPLVKIIAMTAQALPEEMQSMQQAGFDDILIKPFTESQLLQVIQRYVAPMPTDMQLSDAMPTDMQILFAITNSEDLAALDAALQSENTNQVVALLHRLAGRVGQYGYTKWYQQLRSLENQLRANPSDLADCQATLIQLCADMQTADLFEKEEKS